MQTFGLCCLFLSILTFADAVIDKRGLEEILSSQCPRQCRGDISNIYLRKMCTCVSRSGVFMYGKRNGGLTESGMVKQSETRDLLEALSKGKDPLEERRQQRQELLDLLDNKMARKSKDQIQPITDAPLATTAVDIAEELKRLLQNHRQLKEPTILPPTTKNMAAAEDLFESEIGKSLESATKEDYLVWVSNEMSTAESRLIKLMKFYEFIKSTPDVQDQWH